MRKQYSTPPLGREVEARFWAKVVKADGDGCWLWTGGKNNMGYGRIKLNGRTHYAHRVAFALRWGDSPDLEVRHTCDNPSCVNPDHLATDETERSQARRTVRVKKPRGDFPLFPHASGRWAKKIRGKFVYFGKVADDPTGESALNRWLDQRDDLLAGRTPRSGGDGLQVRDLCNQYLTHKRHLLDTREIVERTFRDCRAATDRIVEAFGRTRLVSDLAAADFSHLRNRMAESLGPLALGIEIQRVRSVFKFGYDNGLIDSPVRYGQSFAKPSRKVLRKAKLDAGPRMFSAAELRQIIAAAPLPLRAMILLGINAGLGNRDVAALPFGALDLDAGMLNYPRAKTAVPRRAPLWPEAVREIRDAIECRPEPANPDHADLVFITRQRMPFVKHSTADKGAWTDSVGLAFGKLLRSLGLKRPGLNFYALRHTFRTIADGSRDQPAVDFIMGHAPDASDMRAVYTESIDDGRLQAVANLVHDWLFAE